MNVLADFLTQYGYDHREEIAISYESEKAWSFGELFDLSAKIANALISLGIQPGDRVAVQSPKRAEIIALNLAVVRVGGIYVPLNDSYTEKELQSLLDDAEPSLVIRESPLEISAPTLPISQILEIAQTQSPEFINIARSDDDGASILFTSGTTGRSKGAVLSHRNLKSNSVGLISEWELNSTDTVIHILPLFHIHGLFVAAYSALAAGAKMVMFDKFEPTSTIKAMQHATVLMGVPTHYVRLLAELSFNRSALGSMRLFISGSAPMLLTTHEEFTSRTGEIILERYGMTEAGIITSNPLHSERKVGTVGRAMPFTKIRLAGQAPAEVEVSGDPVLKGYWRRPELNQTEFTPDGWFKTGDIGRIDADGYLEIVGRAKDLVISGGLNVYPREIESIIEELDDVSECAVIGVPDKDFGEAVTAVVTLKNSASIDEAAIKSHLVDRLAKFKIPKKIYIVETLPRNVMGKVEKAKLRKQFAEMT